MRFGLNTDIKEFASYTHTETGQEIPLESVVKCLGVHQRQDATFKHHASAMTNKEKQMALWILRIFKSRDQELIPTLRRTSFGHTTKLLTYNKLKIWHGASPEEFQAC